MPARFAASSTNNRFSSPGATILVHGNLGDGDALRPLANAVHTVARARTDQSSWLLDYDVAHDHTAGLFDVGESVLPTSADAGKKGELVLVFDWDEGTDENSPGWTEAAADALFSMLVELKLVNPAAQGSVPLHFIGHGSGAALTSEVVERLARFQVAVDQVTYLDPHDFVQIGSPVDDVDLTQELFTLGRPQFATDLENNYGVTVWNNVAFADVYYQTRGRHASLVEHTVPEGRPIPGAFNILLNAGLPATYSVGDPDGDHGFIAADFYVASIQASPTATGTAVAYDFSRLASARPKSCLDRGATKKVLRKSLEDESAWFKQA